MALWAAGGGAASADTVTLAQYRGRLVEARALLLTARGATDLARRDLADRAREPLGRTTALQAGDGEIAVRDAALVTGAGDAELARAVADLDLLVATVDRAPSGRSVAPADSALRESGRRERDLRAAAPGLVRALSWVARVLLGLGVAEAIGGAPLALGVAGVGVVLAVVALLGRRLPSGSAAGPRCDRSVPWWPTRRAPARRAEALRAAGRAREAVHELTCTRSGRSARGALR